MSHVNFQCFFEVNRVLEKYFDQTWLDIRDYIVSGYRTPGDFEFGWFNFFNIPTVFPYTIWFISLVIVFSNTKIKTI